MLGRAPFRNNSVNRPVFRLMPAGAGTVAVASSLTDSFGRSVTHTRAPAATYVSDATGLVSSVAANVPIINNGVQSELAATNRVIRSQEFDNAAWTATNVTVTANTHLSPDGVNTTADTLAGTANGGMLESTAFTSSGANATVSLWVRSTTGTQAGQLILRDTTAGADRITVNFTATTTWQRVFGTTTGATGANNHTLQIRPGGAGTGTIVAWGAQHETTSCMTGYIATGAASAARGAATVVTYPAAALPIASAEIRLRVRLTGGLLQAAGLNHCIMDTRSATDGWVFFLNSNGTLAWLSLVSSVSQTTTSGALSWTTGQWYNLRVRWVGGALRVYRDDVAVIDVTGKTMPAAQGTSLFIGCNLSSASQFNGTLSEIEVRR